MEQTHGASQCCAPFFEFLVEDVEGSVSYRERTVGVAQAKNLQFDRETVIFLELNQLDVLINIPCGDARLLIFERVKRQEKDFFGVCSGDVPST